MSIKASGFFAYPAAPASIGQTIELACKQVKTVDPKTWKELDILGHFISTEVLNGIDNSDFLIADISRLNFNVTFEVGYAIGRSKRLLLTQDVSYETDGDTIGTVGIYDTIGYSEYQNATELSQIISEVNNSNPLSVNFPINFRAPVYLLDSEFKTDWSSRIVSRIKKTGYTFRSFDPNEQPRLSSSDAITQVAQSLGVVVPLASTSTKNHSVHNLRAAFVAGLAYGMDKVVTILQQGDDPVPLDYRDFSRVTKHPDDIKDVMAEFAPMVAKASQTYDTSKFTVERSFLKKVNLGSSSAENEMRDLQKYYLETEQFLKCLRGEAHLVVGRKGSGKSAIFLQIRDIERDKSRNQNIVLDLKPDGYKLIKFKENMLSFLEGGTYLHTVTAFWEYVLLLELCHKILEKDRQRHINDHRLFDGYRELVDIYKTDDNQSDGDFSERMSQLMESIYSEFKSQYDTDSIVRLSGPQVTELIHKHDVLGLKNRLMAYLENKGTLWLLFDNIDNGWPTTGLEPDDLMIIRALVDATRKIERDFGRNNLTIHTAIFLRNDVYELLIQQTSDRGKESVVVLDWTDPDLLKEVVRLRIVSNMDDTSASFNSVWNKMFSSHYKGEESSSYLIERSLMRPRFLLNLIGHCKSFAVNLNHEIIEEDDIKKGLAAYSSDLLRDIGYEMRDIQKASDESLYAFIGSNAELRLEEVYRLLSDIEIDEKTFSDILNLLQWYGFLGIKTDGDGAKYIYDYSYNKRIMDGVIKKFSSNVRYVINDAFHPALEIKT